MIFLKLIVTNLLRHRIRSFISIAGIAFSVAAMLTVVTILQGAIGMFSGILSSDSEIIVFERNVSDLFFSNVPAAAVNEIAGWPMVSHADPVLFGIVSSADHPIITCFGVTAADARIRKATWIAGDKRAFAQHPDDVVLGERAAEFLSAKLDDHVPIGHGVFHVIGIVKTANGFEDGGVFMPLDSAQNFFHKQGTSSVITIKLRGKDDAASFKSRVKAAFPNLVGLEDAEFTRSYSQFKILSMLGAASGLLAGTCLLCVLKLVPALHGYVDVTIQPVVMLIVILLALLTGIAGALYPAIYAMCIRAVEALRFE